MVVGTGCATKTWHLPRKLLVNASPFFAAALNGTFPEATSRKIFLPEVGPDSFAFFVRWLHVGEIGCISVAPEDDWVDRTIAVSKTLVQLCVLGDRLGCLVFQDLGMLELIKFHSNKVIVEEAIRYVFDHSAQGSKLRQFVIDQFRWDFQEGFLSDYACAYFSISRFAKDFGPVLLEASLRADGVAIDPQKQKGIYMEVLTATDGN